MPHFIGDLLRDLIAVGHVRSDDLYIDGRGQTEIQNLRDNIGRLEEEFHARKAAWQYFAQMTDVVGGGMVMLGIKRDQNLGIAGTDRSIGAIGLIDAGVWQADVIENRLEFTIRNLLVQRCLDLVNEPRRLLHAQAGTGAYVQTQ